MSNNCLYNEKLLMPIVGICLTICYFSPFFSDILFQGTVPYRFFLSDEVNLYASQFINSYRLYHAGVSEGLDFFTGNGSSEFFLRPNIPVFYPIFKVIFSLNSNLDTEQLLNLYILVISFHLFIGFTFSCLLYHDFVKADIVYSILFGVLTSFSANFLFGKGFSSFVIIVNLLPLALFLVDRAVAKNSLSFSLLAGAVVYLLITGGYLPLAVFSLIVLFLFFFLSVCCRKQKLEIDKGVFFKLLLVFGLPLVISAPWIISVVMFNGQANTVHTTLSQAAHSMSLLPSDIITSLTYAFAPKSTSEIFTRYIGITPLFFAVFFPLLKKEKFKNSERVILLTSLSVVFLMYLLSLGSHSSLPDMFYSIIRPLGTMHIYGRYSELTHVFSSLIFVIILSKINIEKSRAFLNKSLVASLILLSLLLLIEYFGGGSRIGFYNQFAILEICCFSLTLWVCLIFGKRWAATAIMITAFLSSANLFYQPYRIENSQNIAKHISFNTSKTEEVIRFIGENSDKKLVKKVANFDNEITSYFGRAFPWFVSDKIKLANYYGYELHLASYLDYRRKFPIYGTIDSTWIFNTGVDFVVFNITMKDKFNDIIHPDVSLMLNDELVLAKVRHLDAAFDVGEYTLSFNYSGGGCLSRVPHMPFATIKVEESM